MIYLIGLILFALGILISVALHEAGHALSARAFGMKVTRFFIGFGPTLWSFRRGDIEYGVKGIPAGAFVKIVGMTPQDDDVAPEDEPRVMWKYPVWKRTIVLAAGSITHFILGILILWGLFAFTPLDDRAKLQAEPVRIDRVQPCVELEFNVDPKTKRLVECTPGQDPVSGAAQLGLQPGDVIIGVNSERISGWNALTQKIRASGGKRVELAWERGGQVYTDAVVLPMTERVKLSVVNDPKMTVEKLTDNDLEQVGTIGITPVVPQTTAGPIKAVPLAIDQTGLMFESTFMSLQRLPAKIPALFASLTGAERDPETPVSVIGATHIGGVLFERGLIPQMILMLAALNFFIGLFNLLPLLPADGGHIAIAWFEKVRSWLYARLGKADPGRVDYYKMMPLTYAIILIFGAFTLLTVAADIINPINIPS
ncbi:MAG TPA: site-2 protease family protein [Candidatus Limnocylindrales bacterium]|nr:site-2 protease family protein [Candidatus Limnocylindrales bacterium]